MLDLPSLSACVDGLMGFAMRVPSEYELCGPTLQALHKLKGKGSVQEISETVIRQLQLTDETVCQLHGEGPQTELEYRLAWARTVLRACGLVATPRRGLWELTEKGLRQPSVESGEIRRRYLSLTKSEQDGESDLSEDEFWNRLTREQFFAGYAESDSIYNKV